MWVYSVGNDIKIIVYRYWARNNEHNDKDYRVKFMLDNHEVEMLFTLPSWVYTFSDRTQIGIGNTLRSVIKNEQIIGKYHVRWVRDEMEITWSEYNGKMNDYDKNQIISYEIMPKIHMEKFKLTHKSGHYF